MNRYAFIPDAGRIVAAINAATKAQQGYDAEAKQQRIALMNGEDQPIYQRMGYATEVDGRYPHRIGSPQFTQLHSISHEIKDWIEGGFILSEILPDRRVRQRIHCAAIDERLDTVIGSYDWLRRDFPAIDSTDVQATLLAYAIGKLRGPAWTHTGDHLERTLPPWLYRYPVERQPATIWMGKTPAPVIAWAATKEKASQNEASLLVHVSLVGRQTWLRAAWAAAHTSDRPAIECPEYSEGYYRTSRHRCFRPDGKGVFDVFWNDTPLPESGFAHLVMQDKRVLAPITGQPFVHLAGPDATPDLSYFMYQLGRALTLPLRPEWAGLLWQQGMDARLIERCPSYGCVGYEVEADEEKWGDIVRIVRNPAATERKVETFGKHVIKLDGEVQQAMEEQEHDEEDDDDGSN